MGGKTLGGMPNPVGGYRALCFWFIALGYMAPWTFIGSLIAYFKVSRGANFYVEVYAMYYAMGLPSSLVQQRYDTYWDMKFGATRMFLFRGQFNFLIMIGVVLLMPYVLLRRYTMLLLMATLGVTSWTLHGTACQLASMCSTSSISALQTGFRTPEILAIVACYYLDIGVSASPFAIRVFFLMIAVLAVAGLFAWTALVLSPRFQALLAEKDHLGDQFDVTKAPLISTEKSAVKPPVTNAETAATGDRRPADDTLGVADECQSPQQKSEGEAYAAAGDNSRVGSLSRSDMDAIAAQIRDCRLALFFTMFASIFTAAFFAYADSSSGVDLEQVLYFTRLLGDLFGRPFTSLPRPQFLATDRNLANFAIWRTAGAAIFFVYVFVPGVPQSDLFIILYVAVFSVGSGYIGIVSYEYAARDLKSTAAKSYSATLMNTTFQVSMFLAVMLSILISEFIT